MEELEKRLKYNSIVTTNREYPFCICPEAMLRELLDFERIS